MGIVSALVPIVHCHTVTLCHAPPSRDQSGSSAIVILAISPGASQIIKLITSITLQGLGNNFIYRRIIGDNAREKRLLCGFLRMVCSKIFYFFAYKTKQFLNFSCEPYRWAKWKRIDFLQALNVIPLFGVLKTKYKNKTQHTFTVKLGQTGCYYSYE